jgi:hypothetical protein
VSNVLRFSTELDDNVSKKLKGISKAFDKMGGPGSGASFFGNVGAKAVARGFGLIDTAATAVVNVLGDALNAAIEEEASVKKLDTALRANVVGWDGNTAAIERVLTARMALGFSDDEQRQSLSLLLVATNDVAKALDIESTAMDLARLTGTDLETATKALIKTEDGGFRLLKSLGIQIDENATSEEALTAVRKAAEGQALSYANTTAGKLQVAQTKIGEKMEQLGGVIMPAVAGALDNISNAIDFFSGDPSVKGSAALETLRDLFRAVGNAVGWVIDKVAKLIGFLGDVIAAVGRAIDALTHLGQLDKAAQNSIKLPGNRYRGYATGTSFVPETGPAILHRGEQVLSPSMSLADGGRGGAVSGVTIAGISERQIMDMVDRGLYFRFQRAAPTVRRT